MRDHIRREAGQATAAWWLVPIALAVIALAAMATNDAEAPLPLIVPTSAPVNTQPTNQPEAPSLHAAEHVQAF